MTVVARRSHSSVSETTSSICYLRASHTLGKPHGSRCEDLHPVYEAETKQLNILTLVQASAFIMFPDIYSACSAASVLRDETAVDAVEMFDRAALRQVCTTVLHSHRPWHISTRVGSLKKLTVGKCQVNNVSLSSGQTWTKQINVPCRECDNGRMQELVPGISDADSRAAGLLVECRGQTEEALKVRP